MKHIISAALMAASIACLASCEKTAVSTEESSLTDATIVGKWNIVSDSSFQGVGQNNHPVNYTGVAGDYYDFRTDGNVYIKEGPAFDTLSYSNVTDTAITIQAFGGNFNSVQETSTITTITDDNIIIAAPKVYTPGGIMGRTVHLAR